MLERFKVPKEDEVRVPAAALRGTVEALFVKMGVSDEDAQEGANTLVMTDLRGVETHGVSNMLRAYISNYQQGSLNPRPNWRVLHDSPSAASVDADRGLGVIVAPKVMRMAIGKARETGVGAVSMHNSGHTGAVGHHAMLAAEDDMIGVCMTAGWPGIPPTFGAEPRFGTNPDIHRRTGEQRALLPVRRRHVHNRRQQGPAGPAGRGRPSAGMDRRR